MAVFGDIDALQSRLQLEALRQGITTATQVVWISDGARGFWRLFEQNLAGIAVGILDFYHAAQHLWDAAQAYGNTLPTRTPQQWFERLRHQLRHGYVHHIVKEFGRLVKYPSTPLSAKPVSKRVRQYLHTHLAHLQYRQFKRQGFPIGSGMVESACRWLIVQRFKATLIVLKYLQLWFVVLFLMDLQRHMKLAFADINAQVRFAHPIRSPHACDFLLQALGYPCQCRFKFND